MVNSKYTHRELNEDRSASVIENAKAAEDSLDQAIDGVIKASIAINKCTTIDLENAHEYRRLVRSVDRLRVYIADVINDIDTTVKRHS